MFYTISNYLKDIDPIFAALYASLFTWAVTAIGASFVFFFKKVNTNYFNALLGFTGGVMIAASVWSLLIPSMELNEGDGFLQLIPTIIGFHLGVLFLFVVDKILPMVHSDFKKTNKTPQQRTFLMFLAITLHNIPEGLAIGVLFGGVAIGIPGASIETALLLAIGIGLQNFPEGIAVAIPLRRLGMSRFKSFLYGQGSALVEPIAAVIGVIAVVMMTPILPYALAFAAGAMIYVVVNEVIPETLRKGNSDYATLGFMLGFILMMTLDVALG